MATVEKGRLRADEVAVLQTVLKSPLPEHVAIIMDGNGRWAQQLKQDRMHGHRQGVDAARHIVEFVIEQLPLRALTLYAFSTENWSRPKREVEFLMELLQRFLREQVAKLVRKNVHLRILGDIHGLPDSLRHEIERAVDLSSDNSGLHLNIAVNYGGRQEILHAVNQLLTQAKQGKLDQVDEQAFARALYTHGLPDPDLVIRTAEQRLSNFLLWQCAYAEFWTTPTPWPDFDVGIFLQAILDFQRRQRTYGGLNRHA